jgi:hypothetical protein
MTLQNRNDKVELLARTFVALLRRDLSEAEFRTVCVRNAQRTETNGYVCHSHDFIDANMTMDEAFTVALGYSPLDDDQRDPVDDGMTSANIELWNAAHAIASDIYLSLHTQPTKA